INMLMFLVMGLLILIMGLPNSSSEAIEEGVLILG
ncbi:unnamed protein product, partial [marine sediment metagenome]